MPIGDPLRSRLQAWSDHVDAGVVVQALENGAPYLPSRPRIHVAASSAINAWNESDLFFLGASFAGDGFSFLSTTQVASAGVGVFGAARARPSSWPATSHFLDAYAAAGPLCDLGVTSSGTFVSQRCPGSGPVIVSAATPNVVITSALLERVDERTAFVILAHELGHYYRAHASSLAAHQYGFWYEATDRSHRPLPSTRQAELAKRYADVLNAPTRRNDVSLLHHPRMVRLLAYLPFVLSGQSAAKACAAEVTASDTAWLIPFQASDPSAHEPLDIARFRAFEASLAACASNVGLGASSSAKTLARSSVASLWVALGFAESEAQLDGVLNLAAALERARLASVAMDVAEVEMLEALGRGNVGLYTVEQEADQIMLELAAEHGLAPTEVFDAWLDFMQAVEDSGMSAGTGTGDLGAVACRALLDSDFTKVNGSGVKRPVTMTLGDLSDPHHGLCYRLYDMWRETKSHGYVAKGTFAPPPGPSWAVLRAHAHALTPSP